MGSTRSRTTVALLLSLTTLSCGGTDSPAEPAPAPTMSSVTPSVGPATQNTAVTIGGSGFLAGASVTFGGAAATSVSVASGTSLTATTPTGAVGNVDVVVTNVDGQNATLADGFAYLVPLTVDSIRRDAAPACGGGAVPGNTIWGTGFVTGTTVQYGEADLFTYTGPEAAVMEVPIPASTTLETVDIVLTSPDGQSVTLADAFTFILAPCVDSFSPTEGPIAGGTSITITGRFFVDGATVAVGSRSATDVVFNSSTELVATTPAGEAPGGASVTVTNPDGEFGSLSPFDYLASPPTITSVDPDEGSASSGADVTITGTGFFDGVVVTFGALEANPVILVDSTSLLATVPGQDPGPVDVVVTNRDGQSATLADGFTYVAPTQLTKTDWQVDFTFLGGDFRLQVFFEQDGESLAGSNRDNNAELDVITTGRVIGSTIVVTFELSNGGSSRGNVTCTGDIVGTSPQTISGTFTSPSTDAVGGTSGTCTMS